MTRSWRLRLLVKESRLLGARHLAYLIWNTGHFSCLEVGGQRAAKTGEGGGIWSRKYWRQASRQADVARLMIINYTLA